MGRLQKWDEKINKNEKYANTLTTQISILWVQQYPFLREISNKSRTFQ